MLLVITNDSFKSLVYEQDSLDSEDSTTSSVENEHEMIRLNVQKGPEVTVVRPEVTFVPPEVIPLIETPSSLNSNSDQIQTPSPVLIQK